MDRADVLLVDSDGVEWEGTLLRFSGHAVTLDAEELRRGGEPYRTMLAEPDCVVVPMARVKWVELS